jgi:hypothetical protein
MRGRHPYHNADTGVPNGGPAVTLPRSVPTIGGMKRQADLTKRRAVDLCRVAAMLCRMR